MHSRGYVIKPAYMYGQFKTDKSGMGKEICVATIPCHDSLCSMSIPCGVWIGNQILGLLNLPIIIAELVWSSANAEGILRFPSSMALPELNMA